MFTDLDFKFETLVSRFGEASAYQYLEQVERAAGIAPQHAIVDLEERLAKAIRMQDGTSFDRLLAA